MGVVSTSDPHKVAPLEQLWSSCPTQTDSDLSLGASAQGLSRLLEKQRVSLFGFSSVAFLASNSKTNKQPNVLCNLKSNTAANDPSIEVSAPLATYVTSLVERKL